MIYRMKIFSLIKVFINYSGNKDRERFFLQVEMIMIIKNGFKVKLVLRIFISTIKNILRKSVYLYEEVTLVPLF